MKRREILRYAALATGATISAPLMSSILAGCTSDLQTNAGDDYQLQFFKEAEFDLVKNLIDIILPKTDSPSATDVGVHKIIDTMVGKVYNAEAQKAYQAGFQALLGHISSASNGKGWNNLDDGQRLAILQQLDRSTDASLADVRTAYLGLKQQTIAYYLTTEEIGKSNKYLTYLPVPGKYEACVSLEEVGGKAWAL